MIIFLYPTSRPFWSRKVVGRIIKSHEISQQNINDHLVSNITANVADFYEYPVCKRLHTFMEKLVVEKKS